MIPSRINDSQSSNMIRNLPDKPPGQTEPTEDDLDIGRDIFRVSNVTRRQPVTVSKKLERVQFYISRQYYLHQQYHDPG